MGSRTWSTKARAWAALGGVLVLVGTVWPTAWLMDKTADDDGAGIANVLALPVGGLSLVVGALSLVVASWSRPRTNDLTVLVPAARDLLRAVSKSEAATLARLLGDTGRARPADVAFVAPEAAEVSWRDDGGSASGGLDDVAVYYQSLVLGRLVVLGEPGAGKTVLALRLLLDLATDARTTLDHTPTARVRVPVRLSLSSFTLPVQPCTPSVLHERLETWIAGHLSGVYGVLPAIARALVADGWVLPVLDGLDEIDPDHTPPRRARRVLDALNQPTGDAPAGPLVLTCRSRRYRELTHPAPDPAGQRPVSAVVQDATAVLVQPLDIDQVTAWLAHRFPGPRGPHGVHPRWRRVVTTIRNHRRGRLAMCLSSPLRLYLACAVYTDPDSTPAELCDLDPDTLDRHLLDHLVPALTRHHPSPDGTHYHPDDVTRWLATLARHLTTMAHHGHSGTDLHLHHLWATTGTPPGRRIRRQATTAFALLFGLPVAGLGLSYADATGHYLPTTTLEWFGVYAVGVVMLVLIGSTHHAGLQDTSRRLTLARLREPNGRRALIRRLSAGFRAGLGAGLVGGGVVAGGVGVVVVVVVVVVVLVAAVLGVVLTPLQGTAVRPSQPLRQHIASELVGGLAIGLAIGLVVGVGVGLMVGVSVGLAAGLVVGLGVVVGVGVGLAVGLVVGLRLELGPIDAGGGAVLLRYMFAVRVLQRAGHLPPHPARFLDWAYTAGLVRLAGTATQFRHHDLQIHFTHYMSSESSP